MKHPKEKSKLECAARVMMRVASPDQSQRDHYVTVLRKYNPEAANLLSQISCMDRATAQSQYMLEAFDWKKAPGGMLYWGRIWETIPKGQVYNKSELVARIRACAALGTEAAIAADHLSNIEMKEWTEKRQLRIFLVFNFDWWDAKDYWQGVYDSLKES